MPTKHRPASHAIMAVFTLSSPSIRSEDDILSCLAQYFPITQPSVALGRGDDCALFHVEHPFAVSTDLFLENVHFRTSYFTPEDIGYKALAVNLSDLAACGVKPVAFTLSLGIPATIDETWLNPFFSGMAKLATKYNVNLVGGDLSRSAEIHISITIFGETTGVSCFLARGGSMPGDTLFVVGQLGLAHVGLATLERFGRQALDDWPEACHAHLRPQPYCQAGLVLARAAFNARPPALMDVSDGILRDLPRLLGMSGELGSSQWEGPGASLVLTEESLHPEVLRWAHEHHTDPIHIALLGGEDYALLGACAPDLIPSLEAAIPEFQTIGTIIQDNKILCNGVELSSKEGFDHFVPEHT